MSEHGEPRAAIIGAGLMGRWHADAVRRLGGRVTVIVDPNADAREALGRRHHGARLFRELDAADVRRHATAAHVCTPVSTHARVLTELIAGGLHALVEKPFAETATETTSLLAAAKSRGVVVCPVHQFLFQDGVRRVIDWLPSLGRVCRIEFSTCSAGALANDDASLDALVAEILPHPLALTQTILRANLATTAWHVAHPTPGEFRAVATIGTVVADMATSAHGRPTENVLRVVGTSASATADLFHGFAVRQRGAVSRRGKMARPFGLALSTLGSASANLARRAARRETAYPGLRELVQRFYAATSGHGPTPISSADITDIAVARDGIIAQLTTRRVD